MSKKICVIGLGYIGFPTSLVFAKAGYEVVGVDINENVVSALQAGQTHIEETGLTEMFAEVRKSGRFRAQRTPEPADAYIVAVPTPVKPDHSANLDYVVSAVESVLPYLRPGNVVIVESTIPPRTIEDVVAPLLEHAGWNVGEDIYLAHCPERVLPGRIFIELIENNRIVGGINRESAERAAELYRPFVTGEIVMTTAAEAEMAKLIENTFRDVNIALVNELAKVSAAIGVDVLEAIRLANKHPRVRLHAPGPGVGGHCIAVDPYFIIEKAPDLTPLITTARHVNRSMPFFVLEQVGKLVEPHASHKVAVFGLAYKGNVDDVRESPALEIAQLLMERGYRVYAHDPHVRREAVPFELYSAEDALKGAQCAVVLTDHDEFKLLPDTLLRLMARQVVLDTKNCVRLEEGSDAVLYNYGNLHRLNTAPVLAVSSGSRM